MADPISSPTGCAYRGEYASYSGATSEELLAASGGRSSSAAVVGKGADASPTPNAKREGAFRRRPRPASLNLGRKSSSASTSASAYVKKNWPDSPKFKNSNATEKKVDTPTEVPDYVKKYINTMEDGEGNKRNGEAVNRDAMNGNGQPRANLDRQRSAPSASVSSFPPTPPPKDTPPRLPRHVSAPPPDPISPTPTRSSTKKTKKRRIHPLKSSSPPPHVKALTEVIATTEVKQIVENPHLTQKIKLPDGRTLCFSEVGMHGGFPVICLVGMGLNRMITAFYDDLAHSLGLRIITPDRPGVGGSDPVSGFDRRVSTTWPETDLAPLLSHLKINKFILVGNSLGACYALASALHFKFAIQGKIYLLSPWIAESQLPVKDAAPISHRFLRALPSALLKTAHSLISPYDSPGKNADVIVPGDVTASIWAAATTNANAAIDLMTSLERPNKMGFKFEDVNQEVKVWHGSLDSRISPGRVQQVVGRMNRGEVVVVEGAGHGLMGNAKVVSEVLTEIAREVAMR
ncbi:hypothetical protein YB2330_006664 [Saitoella coloradoensis]